MKDEGRQKQPAFVPDVADDQAGAKYAENYTKEVAEALTRVRLVRQEVEKNVEARRESIRRGARRSGSTFRP
jgi:K+-sensing histidine kinase KdpD